MSLRTSLSERTPSDRSRSLSSPRRAKLNISLLGKTKNDLKKAGAKVFAIANPQRKSILSVRAADRKLPVQITNPTQVCSRGQGAHRSKKNRRETNFEKSKRAISLLSKCSINKQRKRVVGLQRRCGVETAMHRCCKRKRNWLLRAAGRV